MASNKTVTAKVEHKSSYTCQALYDAWLDAKLIREWLSLALKNAGLPGEMLTVEVEPSVGGQFCFSDKRPSGDAVHWGTYFELKPAKFILFSWDAGSEIPQNRNDEDASRVAIYFTSHPNGSHVKLEHEMDAEWETYLDRVQSSWQRMLIAIDSILTSRKDAL